MYKAQRGPKDAFKAPCVNAPLNLQALAMLNNPFVIRQSVHIAARLAAEASTPEAQAAEAFRLILLREAGAEERAKVADYIRRHGPANACHLLLNGAEFLYLD